MDISVTYQPAFSSGKVTLADDRYDPAYDPLVHENPGRGRDYAPTYWIGTAGEPPPDDGPIDSDRECDVVIIGSGFTGLNAAIALARDHGVSAVVLEANRSSWGCSTRNGGQAQCASGRLKRSQWIERWGMETAQSMHQECLDAMQYFKEMINDIDCDAQPGGHFYIAHRPSMMPSLEREAKLLRDRFGYDAQIINADVLKTRFVHDHEAAGAMHEPEGIAIHAGKLAFGYLRKARALGAKVHPASPVTGMTRQGDRYLLQTPGGTVRARAVGIATGGYTSSTLHPELRNRLMPVLSNSIVTRPLTDAEIKACGFRTRQVLTDTRVLRHYYRLLPDNRVQIGSRSAITGQDAPDRKYQSLLIQGLCKKFPSLKGVQIDYSWWGWVDVSHDMMPRIYQPIPAEPLFYALGYGGNGVMYSAQAGRRLAQWIAGDRHGLDLPIFQSRLPFPNLAGSVTSECLAPFRRIGQRLLYRWYYLKDEIL